MSSKKESSAKKIISDTDFSDDVSDLFSDEFSDEFSEFSCGDSCLCSNDSDDISGNISSFSGDSGKKPEKLDVIYEKISQVFRELRVPSTEEETIDFLKEYYDDESVDEFVSGLSGESSDNRFDVLQMELAEARIDEKEYASGLVLLMHLRNCPDPERRDVLKGISSYYFAYDPEYDCPEHLERYLEKSKEYFEKCLEGKPGKDREKICKAYLKRIEEEKD